MLKTSGDLLRPDARFLNMVSGITDTGAIRFMDISDLLNLVRPLELHPETPAIIREQFDKARHAFIYSWFSYDLATLAEQQGYQVLEMALREKLPPDEQFKAKEKRWGLDTLLKRATSHRWLNRADFEVHGPYGRNGKMCLLDMLPMFRNELAHGSPNLFPGGALEMLRLCVEILNKLFAPPRAGLVDAD